LFVITCKGHWFEGAVDTFVGVLRIICCCCGFILRVYLNVDRRECKEDFNVYV